MPLPRFTTSISTPAGSATLERERASFDRQIRRWSGQLELTLPMTRPVPDLEKLGEWLHDNRPDSPTATLVHGDYKLDNVMFAGNSPCTFVTILDWEMSTLGDPLADLGWMASFWLEAGEDDDDALADLGPRDEAGRVQPIAELDWTV